MNHHLAGPKRRIRVISFLVAREYYEVAATKWICKAVQSIPVGRDGRDMAPAREALRRLQAGELVALFPEGKINTGPSGAPLLPGDTGVAWLALRAQVPVYPVYIHNAPGCANMIAPFITPTRVKVCFGDPIDLSAYRGRKNTREILQEVTDLLMAKLEETGRETTLEPAESDDEPANPILSLKRIAN
jgi:1-acyl-sn-glycerol-3-phosphate acyltransferase